MRISDWSSDVCSADLRGFVRARSRGAEDLETPRALGRRFLVRERRVLGGRHVAKIADQVHYFVIAEQHVDPPARFRGLARSEERSGGKACVSTWRSRGSPYHLKTNKSTAQKKT